MNRRILTLDGPRANREYSFPEYVDEFQVNAIMPGETPFEPAYYTALIYRVVPAGFGVWHGLFVRKAERAR